jgi:hypothetical protein
VSDIYKVMTISTLTRTDTTVSVNLLFVEFFFCNFIYISCVLVFFGFCGKRLLLIVSDIYDWILEFKNLMGCGGGMICSYMNS